MIRYLLDTNIVSSFMKEPLGKVGQRIAHALALDCTLVTDNEGEFRRVPGLRVENWLSADGRS